MVNRNITEPQSSQRAGTYIFGEKSKFANWALNHPFYICGGAAFVGLLVGDHDKVHLIRSLIIAVSLLGVALILRLLCRNLCYRVKIDTVAGVITFFRCFDKGIIEAPIKSVEFLFDKHFAAIYGGEKFTIFNEYMGGIAQVLSPEKDIKFSSGIYARFMKRQFEKSICQGE